MADIKDRIITEVESELGTQHVMFMEDAISKCPTLKLAIKQMQQTAELWEKEKPSG